MKTIKSHSKKNYRLRENRSLALRVLRFGWKFCLYGFLLSLFYILITKWVNPPVTLTQVVSLITGHGCRKQFVDLKNMSPNIKLAILCGEDQLFPDHDGFDFKSMEKAMKHNQSSKSLRGASTISQQAAKNVFLWQHGGYLRKGLEVYFTFMIERIWGKRRILELYLNEAEMGDGVFGIEAASRKYFNKSAITLTRVEAAMIAACLPNPKVFTVKPLSAHVGKRYPWILHQMTQLEADEDVYNLTR